MIRIPTIERYLARQIYAAVGFVLLGFLALFAFFDLIAELRDLGMGNYQLRQIFTAVALWMPGHAYELVPIAVLIGTLYVLAHLSSNSEYTVMRAAGLSPWRAGWMLAKVGLVFVVLTFAIGEWIAPFSEEAAQQVRMRAMQSLIGGSLPLRPVVQGRALLHQRARGARCRPAAGACGSTNSTPPSGCARSPKPSAASTPATAAGAWWAWRRRCSGPAGRPSRAIARRIGARR